MLKKRSEGKKMRNLLILGAGGHGHVVAETAKAMRHSYGNPVNGRKDFLNDLKIELIGKIQDLLLFKDNIRTFIRKHMLVCLYLVGRGV